MLEIAGFNCAGNNAHAISAVMLVTAAPSANNPLTAVRRKTISTTMAKHEPNHALVVTASNMLELGQRSLMYQRNNSAAVCRMKAAMNTTIPARRAHGHFHDTPKISNATLAKNTNHVHVICPVRKYQLSHHNRSDDGYAATSMLDAAVAKDFAAAFTPFASPARHARCNCSHGALVDPVAASKVCHWLEGNVLA